MSSLHDALKTLGPLDFNDTPLDSLKSFLSDAFSAGQLIVDSVPIPAPSEDLTSSPARSRASSTASSASEISLSSARSEPPPAEVEALQKEWKQIKMNPRDNPLGMSVYKLAAKDGKGAWFARRSVHEGLGFAKWKRGLEKEFPETMKVQGGPGEGNIRGIGGERRVEYKNVDGVGKMEVYLLSAQFPGPTTPRDFVTMFLTSDQALKDQSGGDREVPRHFMVISKPCIHPDTPPRDGYIRGQYESVEFIREVPRQDSFRRSASTTNLHLEGHSRKRSGSELGREAVLRNARKFENGSSESREPSETGRSRGKTISFDHSRGSEAKGEEMDIPRDDENEDNPIEWIMITRSDPGGSVPRFMIERGTPGGIVADASKFLNWACAKDMEDFDSDDETLAGDDKDEKASLHSHRHNHELDLHNYQTNGHLAGIEEAETPKAEVPNDTVENSGLYGMVTGVATAAGGYIASHTPAIISDHFPTQAPPVNGSITSRRNSTSSSSSISSTGTFESALEKYPSNNASLSSNRVAAAQDKELAKLEERKRKLEEKLEKSREREISKKSEDSAKEEEAIRKVEERHEREIKKQEEKYRKEVEKLERKKQKEAEKAEARRRKAAEKDERTKLLNELEQLKIENAVLKKEKEVLRGQVGDLQAENTALAARVGRLGAAGEELLRDVRAEKERGIKGRVRASSLKGVLGVGAVAGAGKAESVKSSGSGGSGEGKRDPSPLINS